MTAFSKKNGIFSQFILFNQRSKETIIIVE